MKLKTDIVLLTACCVFAATDSTLVNRHVRNMNDGEAMDVADFSVYYDLKTNETIKNLMPRPWYTPGWLLRLPFTGGKCSCEELKCSCCTGIRLNVFNFNRKTCVDLTYDPLEFTMDLEVKMNNNSIYRNTFSARNPPPFCVPIVVPYLPPGLMDMCVMLFDVTLQQSKLHVCMDMNTRIDKAPVVILHFDCMDMGFGGVSLSKPGGGNQTTPAADTEVAQLNGDVYDPVFEEQAETTPTVFNKSIKYI